MSEARIEITLPQSDADEAEQIVDEALSEAGILHSVEVYR